MIIMINISLVNENLGTVFNHINTIERLNIVESHLHSKPQLLY